MAFLLAREGVKIALLDRSLQNSHQTATQIRQAGGESIAISADISNPEQVEQAFQEIGTRWQHVDVVVANAGINGVWSPIEELSPEEWDKTLSINLTGTFLTLKYAVPHLKPQGGSVVIVSSVNGTRMFSNTGATAYACSKAAQVALAKMVALELAPHQIRVNAICPGAIKTKISNNTQQRHLEETQLLVDFPEGKIPLTRNLPGTSIQVAQLILFLVSDASSHITGTEIWIDGGESLLRG